MNIHKLQRAMTGIALAMPLCIAAPVVADPSLGIDQQAIDNFSHQDIVTNMSADLQDFGVGQEQAAMLAEQTADFGTEGMIVTVAALGMGIEQAMMLIAQQEQLNANGATVADNLTAKMD